MIVRDHLISGWICLQISIIFIMTIRGKISLVEIFFLLLNIPMFVYIKKDPFRHLKSKIGVGDRLYWLYTLMLVLSLVVYYILLYFETK